MNPKKVALAASVIAGSGISIAGVLLPFATLPTGEPVHFLELNQTFALALILLALVAAGLGFTKWAKFALVPASIAAGLAGYGVNVAFARIEAAIAQIEALIQGSPFGELAQGLLGEFVIHDTWTLMFIGTVVSFLGSLLLLIWRDSSFEQKAGE
jgi:hypothetical protein